MTVCKSFGDHYCSILSYASCLCDASQRLDDKDPKLFGLLVHSMNAATALPAYGYLDCKADIWLEQSISAVEMEESLLWLTFPRGDRNWQP